MITAKLDAWGIPYTLHEPECFISHPLAATVRTLGPDGKSFRAKTVAMSVSTDGEEIEGELIYIPGPSGQGYKAGDIFSAGVNLQERSIAGKIVITEGMAAPGKVIDLMKGGALAGVFVNPGQNIHEGICTSIWGTPDLDNQGDQPTIPAIAVNNPSGLELIEHAKAGGSIALSTTLETKWRTIPVLVADVKGTVEPEKYVLLHGHLDGWHYGAGDNITGDATIAEIARVFNAESRVPEALPQGRLVVWPLPWPLRRLDLVRRRVRNRPRPELSRPGQLRLARLPLGRDVQRPLGAHRSQRLRHGTPSPRSLASSPQPSRPPRAGDYSFNGIGLTGFYMLSSTMSEEAKAEKNYYPVGGCGANIEWHTEDDLIHILDKDILLRDIKMYAASVLRVVNAPVAPFNFRATTAEFRATLDTYQAAAEGVFDFGHDLPRPGRPRPCPRRLLRRHPRGPGGRHTRIRDVQQCPTPPRPAPDPGQLQPGGSVPPRPGPLRAAPARPRPGDPGDPGQGRSRQARRPPRLTSPVARTAWSGP